MFFTVEQNVCYILRTVTTASILMRKNLALFRPIRLHRLLIMLVRTAAKIHKLLIVRHTMLHIRRSIILVQHTFSRGV